MSKIEQSDARILREALAKLTKLRNQFVTKIASEALLEYAKSVYPHCECPEVVLVPAEDRLACLDCGRRHRVSGQQSLYVVPPEPKQLEFEEKPDGESEV